MLGRLLGFGQKDVVDRSFPLEEQIQSTILGNDRFDKDFKWDFVVAALKYKETGEIPRNLKHRKDLVIYLSEIIENGFPISRFKDFIEGGKPIHPFAYSVAPSVKVSVMSMVTPMPINSVYGKSIDHEREREIASFLNKISTNEVIKSSEHARELYYAALGMNFEGREFSADEEEVITMIKEGMKTDVPANRIIEFIDRIEAQSVKDKV